VWVYSSTWLLKLSSYRRSEHMTPVLRDLHWLPIRQRVTFKTAVLVYKCIAWLRSTCGNIASRCHLSSAASVNPHALVDCPFHEPGQITATTVSQYRDLGHGTVFLLTFEPQKFQSKHSDINWRHFCLQSDCRFSALAALRDFALYKCT